jgi:hypothetical protein
MGPRNEAWVRTWVLIYNNNKKKKLNQRGETNKELMKMLKNKNIWVWVEGFLSSVDKMLQSKD